MRRDAGFTLLELLMALLIAAIVVTAAHQTFAAAIEGSRRLVSARQRLDRDANARRLLKALFLSLEVGADSGKRFEGSPHRAAFAAWNQTEGGWFELRNVVLTAEKGRLTVELGTAAPLILRDSVAELSVDYLLVPGADARWVRQWISEGAGPLAVRMRITAMSGIVDTLLFLVGERA